METPKDIVYAIIRGSPPEAVSLARLIAASRVEADVEGLMLVAEIAEQRAWEQPLQQRSWRNVAKFAMVAAFYAENGFTWPL